MRVDLEKPLDTAEDIFKSGKSVSLMRGTYYYGFLAASENDWQRRISTAIVGYYAANDQKDTYKKVAVEGSQAVLVSPIEYIDFLRKNPELKSIAKVHFSKETLKGNDPAVWAIQKLSPWRESLNRHILLLDQVLINLKP